MKDKTATSHLALFVHRLSRLAFGSFWLIAIY
jgi:hypothetical protein